MAALPSTGITTSMVAQAIGAGTNDVGSLCKHTNVNKWSKYKPVRLEKVTGLTESDFKQANFGFNILASSDSPSVDILSRYWDYLKPIGGSATPFRLGDFRQYDHNEGKPLFISDDYLEQLWNIFMSDSPYLSVALTYKINGTSYFGSVNNRLNIEDLSISNTGTWEFKNLYLSVGAFEGSTFHCVTAPAALSSGVSNGGANISSISGTTLAKYINNYTGTEPITIYTFLNTRNDSYTVGNDVNYYVGNIIPLPTYQPISYTKDSNFWLLFDASYAELTYPVDGSTSNPNYFNVNIPQSTYDGIKWTYKDLGQTVKQKVLNLSDTDIMRVCVAFNLYGNSNYTKRDISFSEFEVKSNLFNSSSDIANLHHIYIPGKVVNGSFSTVGVTMNSFQNTTYTFTDASSSDYYIVEFYFDAPLKQLRAWANLDASAPEMQRFTVDATLIYNDKNLPYRLAPAFNFRFHNVG